MAITQNTYTGNGSTVLYSFTFPYLETTDIKVSLNGVDTTAYTLANATTVQFNSAPANGAAIRIYRQTDDTSTKATFFPGSAIRSQDLNDNFLQVLYKSQETETFAAATDASAIQATANTALANSNTAITTANAASATANGIAGTANTALNNSTAAVSTANTASSTATAAQTTANAALPKAGGTMTGPMIFDASQTFPSSGITAGTTSTPGIVQLTDSTSSTSTTTAATPNSVKTTYDAALLKTGGTMTGLITFAAGQTFPVAADYQEFTSNGTWTKPTSCTMVYVELVGGGSGGGSGARRATTSARGGGGGGSGGAGLYKVFRASDLTATVSVTVGAGGSGGVASTVNDTFGFNGGPGGNTAFGTYLESGTPASGLAGLNIGFGAGFVSYKAVAGSNAGAGASSLFGSGGPGGSLAFIVGGAGGGGGGGAPANTLTTVAGGNGGFNAFIRSSTSYASSPGSNAISGEGGGGAGGSYVTATNGMSGGNGAFPGGGGGGGGPSDNGFTSGAGGNGAAGVVRVWSW